MHQLDHWLAEYTPSESLDLMRTLALMHCEQVTDSRARPIELLIRRGDIKGLCEYSLDPSETGWDPLELYHCRQAVALFSKIESLDIGIDKEAAATETFREAEALCKSTNLALRAHRLGAFSYRPQVESWLYTASRKIAAVLGPVPPSFSKLRYRFGKGATTLTKKRYASLRSKFADGVSCSEELLPAASAVLGELPALCEAWASALSHTEEESWYSVPVHLHNGRLEFVPKTCKTHRAVVTEPVLNGLVQLAQGDDLAVRLRRAGVDIRDQSLNQRLAERGSRDGDLATIDLKSASDTVALELVYHLLPLDWAHYLSRSRTGTILVRGESVKLEKFSSMGNGYTFPLETLIFWGLASAVCDGEIVSVYGDDIIVPSARFDEVVELLKTVGFIPNEKKSYAKGPFRESCGRDYYKGTDVRPYFQKKWVSPASLFVLHNFYVRRGLPQFSEIVRGWIKPALQIYGPDGYGDGHLLGDFEKVRKTSLLRGGWGGYTFKTYVKKAPKDLRPEMPTDLCLPSYAVYTSNSVTKWPGTLASNVLKYPRGFFHRSTHGVFRDTLPIPVSKAEDGSDVKALDFPASDSQAVYKRVSVYTF
ncbi:RNA-directed RNA polymerase [ssRNA phage SRR7976299_8]|uniref:RNA-directed RNA polymerase n=1 Tax=ssRNA phage SRR7976299_8 TaxID=2786648 RepID=A0A8S5L0U8_9VIRU|nr:RNA-directed RNA polymerase [ssRNA phage SRR7976299_8]DAD51063.1 TPA_asm: RNA-directed RNA polymerase [ssRNA phage SRR7976299_8]